MLNWSFKIRRPPPPPGGPPPKITFLVSPTHLFGYPGLVGELPLQKRQVRPEEWQYERPQREVGRFLKTRVEFLDRDISVLKDTI